MNKKFYRIGEVAESIGVETHVLRFWESKFTQIKPTKRPDGRRYYRTEDRIVIEQIRHLLYDQGYTIKGAQKALSDGSAEAIELKTVPTNELVKEADNLPTPPETASQDFCVSLLKDIQTLTQDIQAQQKKLSSL
jgi:DNA-binding transcriptional MerR regulator